MTQTGAIVRRLLFYTMLLILSAASGCSTADEQFLDSQGAHPAGWISPTGSSGHPPHAIPGGGSACRECHGDDLRGGISRVSCYTASWDGFSCHAAGPAFHPADWVRTHPASARPDGASCKPCHGADLQGVTPAVSCSSASWEGIACHAGGPAFHPLSWMDCTARGTKNPDNTYNWHATAYGNNKPPCSTCHDLNVKCVICHFDIGGRKAPVGSSWAHGRSGHDDSAIADNPSVNTAICVNCHTTHNRFGQPPVCHNCH